MIEIILVRHALPDRSTNEGLGDKSIADPSCSVVGVEQSFRLSSFLAEEGIDNIFVSPAKRAIQTAIPIERQQNVPMQIVEGLAEWDYGSNSYIPVEELRAEGNPKWHALSNGDFYDSTSDPDIFRNRVVSTVEEILRNKAGKKILLVTHAGVINAYLGHLLSQTKPFWLPLPWSPSYASTSRVKIFPDGKQGIVSINESSYVRDLLPK
jgi:probable phosphoglycerate mutase